MPNVLLGSLSLRRSTGPIRNKPLRLSLFFGPSLKLKLALREYVVEG